MTSRLNDVNKVRELCEACTQGYGKDCPKTCSYKDCPCVKKGASLFEDRIGRGSERPGTD